MWENEHTECIEYKRKKLQTNDTNVFCCIQSEWLYTIGHVEHVFHRKFVINVSTRLLALRTDSNPSECYDASNILLIWYLQHANNVRNMRIKTIFTIKRREKRLQEKLYAMDALTGKDAISRCWDLWTFCIDAVKRFIDEKVQGIRKLVQLLYCISLSKVCTGERKTRVQRMCSLINDVYVHSVTPFYLGPFINSISF